MKMQSSLFGGQRMRQAPSSYKREEANLIFEKIELKTGDVFVDLGCGTGNFSLHAAGLVGNEGKVYAIDLWTEMLEKVANRAKEANFDNILTIENNICESINLEDSIADICFISNVLHGQKINGNCPTLLSEIARFLKPNGRLSIIEFKKEEMPFGPPLNIRISPEELSEGVSAHSFQKISYLDLGYHYMTVFQKE